MPDNEDQKKQKWALLIGVNDYPLWAERYQLRACINDVNALEKLLTSKQFRFPADNILKLTSPCDDPKRLANRQNILDAFQTHLIGNPQIQSGDVVVIYFSGHGSQVLDKDSDEEGKYDETLVPCDSGPDHKNDIIDDKISELLDRLTERTKNVNLFFDSCHSGTVTRLDAREEETQDRARWLPPPEGTPAAVDAPGSPRRKGTRSMGPSGWLPLSDGYVVISACNALERARERLFLPSLKRYGILTYCLLQAMRDVDENTNYYDIWDTVRLDVNRRCRSQHPQLEGAFERRVFGGATLPRKRYVEVLDKTDSAVTVAAGLVHGATAGSRFALFPQGTEVFHGSVEPIAVVKLAQVDAFSAVADLESGNTAEVAVGTPAIEIEHDYGSMQMMVRVVGDKPEVQAVRQQIVESALLSLQEDDKQPATATVRLRCPLKPDGTEDTEKEPMLYIQSSGDAEDLFDPVPPDDEAPAAVRQKLQEIAKYNNLLAIRNTDPASNLAGKVRIVLKEHIMRDGLEERLLVERDAGGNVALKAGEVVAIYAENQSKQDVHVALFDCGPNWEIVQIFPKQGAPDDSVAAGYSRLLVRNACLKYDKEIDERLPPPRETLRLFATTERVNFRSFWAPGIQPGTRGDIRRGSLARVVSLAAGGGPERATRSHEEKQDGDAQDWTTDDLVVHITEGKKADENHH